MWPLYLSIVILNNSPHSGVSLDSILPLYGNQKFFLVQRIKTSNILCLKKPNNLQHAFKGTPRLAEVAKTFLKIKFACTTSKNVIPLLGRKKPASFRQNFLFQSSLFFLKYEFCKNQDKAFLLHSRALFYKYSPPWHCL